MPDTPTAADTGSSVGSLRQLIRNIDRFGRWRMTFFGKIVERMFLPILGGPVFFAILRTACQLNLFKLLLRRPGLTLEDLAAEVKLEHEPLRVLLLGLVSLQLLRKRGEKYYCRRAPLMRGLDPDQAINLLPFIEFMHHIVAPSMHYLEESLRENRAAGLEALPGTGDNLYERIDGNADLQQVFYNMMNARTRVVNEFFVQLVDFSKFQRVLDVGGGDGQILEAIATRYPHLQGTLLEFPSVAEKANQRFASCGLSNRLQAVAVDILQDDYPGGHDCLLFCHVNGNHSPETNAKLLRRAFDALVPGGVICVYSAFMHDDATGPLSSALVSAYFFCTVTGEGRQYSWQEVETWLKSAGFVDVTRQWIVQNHGIILGRKG
jgi:SAM-dependent methyltransferase